jgi:hypothetical protein
VSDPRSGLRAEQVAAADRAASTVFRDMTPNPAARLLSFGVRRRERRFNDLEFEILA